jgi:hypothetical protein
MHACIKSRKTLLLVQATLVLDDLVSWSVASLIAMENRTNGELVWAQENLIIASSLLSLGDLIFGIAKSQYVVCANSCTKNQMNRS